MQVPTERLVRKNFGTAVSFPGLIDGGTGGTPMKKTATAIAIAAAILATGLSAEAATKKDRNTAVAQREASCKAQAAKKYSAIHFLKRRDYVNKCMGHDSQAKAGKAKARKGEKSS